MKCEKHNETYTEHCRICADERLISAGTAAGADSLYRLDGRLRVKLPCGGTATVTVEGSRNPELLAALNTMTELAKKAIERTQEEPPIAELSGGLTERSATRKTL